MTVFIQENTENQHELISLVRPNMQKPEVVKKRQNYLFYNNYPYTKHNFLYFNYLQIFASYINELI